MVQKFPQLEGLNKTYAHYILFKEDSVTLDAVLKEVFKDEKDEKKKRGKYRFI